MDTSKLLIGGELVDGELSMDVMNPSTGGVLVRCPRASAGQLEQAVAAAKASLPGWAAVRLDERRARVLQLAAAIARNREGLARLLTLEQGKPLTESLGEVDGSVAMLEYFVSLSLPAHPLEEDSHRYTEQRALPLGVVAAITAWNYPLSLAAGKIGPAVLAGNAVILKPAPTTPLTAVALGELAAKILPAGVLNVLTDINDLGPKLSAHPDVNCISFTGSTATGKRIMASAAGTLKRLTLELGGNDPAIVLDDADLDVVAPGIFASAFANAGQVCRAIKRLYVHESQAERLEERLRALAARAVVEDGFAPGVQIGPIQNDMQLERLQELLRLTRQEGGAVFGGERVQRDGYFMRPAIVTGVHDESPIVTEEQFGPILPILRFSSDTEALERANHGPYGLGASVWSSSPDRGADVARQLIAGTVTVNQHMEVFGPSLPLAGARQSGIGSEYGAAALAEYTQIQILSIAR